MNVRRLPEQSERVETGPIQFGDDWPGVFIRGDNAAYMAMTLKSALERNVIRDDPIGVMQIEAIQQLLASAVIEPAAELVAMKAEESQTNAEHHESLLGFAQEIMEAWPHGDVDGGELQRVALDHGILVEHNPTEPCGDNCDCKLAYPPGDFELGEVVCYRLAEWMK